MKKKILILILTVCLLFGTAATFLWCASRWAPKVEDIYDRVVELIEASNELNTVIYGAGLPVYPTDSLYAEFSYLYFDFAYEGDYEMVSAFSKFKSVDEIKYAAEQVYSAAYLNDVIYPALFDGYAIQDGRGGIAFAFSRYLTEDEWLYQSTKYEISTVGKRIYDYSTMKVVSPSTSNACFVEMSSWLDTDPDTVTTARLRIVLQDDGKWYFDSFTG